MCLVDFWYCTGECTDDSDWDKVRAYSPASSIQIKDLTANTTYKIKVRLVTLALVGSWSSVATGTTLTATTLTALTTPDISVVAGDADTELDVSWDSVVGATNYDVWHCTGQCTNDSDWTKTNITDTSKTLPNTCLLYTSPSPRD